MPSFLARRKKTKTRRPVSFRTRHGRVSFTARRRPKRRTRAEW